MRQNEPIILSKDLLTLPLSCGKGHTLTLHREKDIQSECECCCGLFRLRQGDASASCISRCRLFGQCSRELKDVGYYFIPIYAVYGVGCLLDTAAWKIILTTPSKDNFLFQTSLRSIIAGESMYRFIPAGVVVGEACKNLFVDETEPIQRSRSSVKSGYSKIINGIESGAVYRVRSFLGDFAFASERACTACFRRHFLASARRVFVDGDQAFSRGRFLIGYSAFCRGCPLLETRSRTIKFFLNRPILN